MCRSRPGRRPVAGREPRLALRRPSRGSTSRGSTEPWVSAGSGRRRRPRRRRARRRPGLRHRLQEARVGGVGRPDPGVAVGLQLGPDRPARGARRPRRAGESPSQVLDVVAVLVGEDIRLGRAARPWRRTGSAARRRSRGRCRRTGRRAVERPGRRAREAAAGVDRVGEEPRPGGLVALPGPGELVGPVGLDAVDVADDPAVLARVRVGPGLALVGQRRARRPDVAPVADHLPRTARRGRPAIRRAARRRSAMTSPIAPPPPIATPRPPTRRPRTSSTWDGSSDAPGRKVTGVAPWREDSARSLRATLRGDLSHRGFRADKVDRNWQVPGPSFGHDEIDRRDRPTRRCRPHA